MTLQEAIAAQPTWVVIWANWLLVGAYILPLALLIWRESRLAGIVTALASVVAGTAIDWMFGAMGYVKLLGLPHVLIWTPLVYFLFKQVGKAEMPAWPRRIIWVIIATILVSLAFDYVDVARYLLGEREPKVFGA